MKAKVFNYIFIFFVIFLFLFFFLKNIDKFPNNSFARMNVIVDFKTDSDTFLNVDNELYKIPVFNNIANKTINKKVKTLILYLKNKKEVNDIIVFNGVQPTLLTQIKPDKEKQLCINNKCNIYQQYNLSDLIPKLNRNSSYINYYSNLNTICAFITSIFKFNHFYFLPYLLIIFFVIFKKEKLFISNYSNYILFVFLIIISILLRYNGLFDNLFVLDEYYTINTVNSFIDCFKDAGNPPFYYLLLRSYLLIFPFNFISLKLFSFIISAISAFVFWFLIKKLTDIKTANLALFLYAINIPLIYYSQELRSYSIETVIIITSVYFFFQLLNSNKNKDFIFYAIISIISINTHYYNLLFIVFCFVFGMFKISKECQKKFLFSNLMIFSSFLPYFLLTCLKGALLNLEFNLWLPEMNLNLVVKCLKFIFGGIISFIFSLVFCAKSFLNKEKTIKKELAIFSYCAIAFVFLSSVLISCLYKTILVERYTIILIILFVVFLSTVYDFKNKFLNIAFIFWIFLIQNANFTINYRHKGLVEMPLSYSKQYKDIYENKNVAVYFLNFSEKIFNSKEYLKYKNDDIVYKISDKKSLKKPDVKNSIIFTTITGENINLNNLSKGYTCYFNSQADICLWKIEKY